jgi:hypothetical protein
MSLVFIFVIYFFHGLMYFNTHVGNLSWGYVIIRL